MQQEQEDLFEYKTFSLRTFKQLHTVILVISMLFVFFSFIIYFFIPNLSAILGFQFSGGFNFSIMILIFIFYGFFQKKMLRKVIATQPFQEKVNEYYKFYRLRLLLLFTTIVVACISLVMTPEGSNVFWVIINTILIFFSRPNTKIILQELNESEVTFI